MSILQKYKSENSYIKKKIINILKSLLFLLFMFKY